MSSTGRRPGRSTSLALLLVATLCLVGPAAAAEKFEKWFRQSQIEFDDVSTNTCNVTLDIYRDEYRRLGGAAWIDFGAGAHPIYQLCKDHVSCILENVKEQRMASLTTSSVVLGILPALLAVLSPSIAEIALLATHRPLLALVLSVGSPGVLQTRIFEYEDPAQTLDLPDDKHVVTRMALALGPWGRRMSVAVSLLEYAVALASVVNVLYLCIQLGVYSISTWGCTRSWPPMLWAVAPLLIHGLGIAGYRLTLDRGTRVISSPPRLPDRTISFFTTYTPRTSESALESGSVTGTGSATGTGTDTSTSTSLSGSDIKTKTNSNTKNNNNAGSQVSTTVVHDNEKSAPPTAHTPFRSNAYDHHHPPPSSTWARIRDRLAREFLPTAYHPPAIIHSRLPLTRPSTAAKLGIFLNCLAGFLSCMHLLFGTVTLSGLLFIATLDAIQEVMIRFFVSSLFCRFIVLVEIAGMRGARIAAVRSGLVKD